MKMYNGTAEFNVDPGQIAELKKAGWTMKPVETVAEFPPADETVQAPVEESSDEAPVEEPVKAAGRKKITTKG